jgi:hypothetical protein
MIRDPSDGSVRETRENPAIRENPKRDQNVELSGNSGQLISGLPPTTDPKEIDRLNRSRDWMKQWNEGRGK